MKKELSSGISRILSFIRRQEKDFLLPLFTDTGILKTLSLRQKEVLEGIGRHLLTESEQTAVLTKRSEQIINGLKYLISKQKEKEILKDQFSQLLDYYINQREEMGWTTSSVKKEYTNIAESLTFGFFMGFSLAAAFFLQLDNPIRIGSPFLA